MLIFMQVYFFFAKVYYSTFNRFYAFLIKRNLMFNFFSHIYNNEKCKNAKCNFLESDSSSKCVCLWLHHPKVAPLPKSNMHTKM